MDFSNVLDNRQTDTGTGNIRLTPDRAETGQTGTRCRRAASRGTSAMAISMYPPAWRISRSMGASGAYLSAFSSRFHRTRSVNVASMRGNFSAIVRRNARPSGNRADLLQRRPDNLLNGLPGQIRLGMTRLKFRHIQQIIDELMGRRALSRGTSSREHWFHAAGPAPPISVSAVPTSAVSGVRISCDREARMVLRRRSAARRTSVSRATSGIVRPLQRHHDQRTDGLHLNSCCSWLADGRGSMTKHSIPCSASSVRKGSTASACWKHHQAALFQRGAIKRQIRLLCRNPAHWRRQNGPAVRR